jgi:hypothetical protein
VADHNYFHYFQGIDQAKTICNFMTRQTLLFIVSLLLMLFLASCQMKKKYYYREGTKEEKLIEAYSDSSAYMEAYKNFAIAKKVYNDMKKSFGGSSLDIPKSFELLNDKHLEITSKIFFAHKDSLENDMSYIIDKLPNNIEQSVTKAREEKNGIGAKYDTGGLYLAPVKVLTAKFVTKEYSSYKDISLRYKNINSKIISGIKFKWYGENAFNEPADMGGLLEGWGGGFTDNALRPGSIDNGEWSILSRDGKKILIAYPYEVIFKDGTKWKLNQ